MQRVKLGIIGCGIATRDLHWPALQKVKDKFQIAVVCNHTEPKAKEFAEMAGGVPYVLDYRDLLENPDVEAVDIVLPIHLNYQVTRDALEADKHVIVEKPLASNLSDAKKMVEFEARYSQVKMVAENFRYHPVFHRAKSLLDEGKIGQPYAVFWDIFSYIDPLENKYAQTKWRINHQYPGGFITDAGVHDIAALRLMFGDIIAGNAFTKSIDPRIGVIDSFSLQFVTENEVHGVLNMFVSTRELSKNRISVLGTEGNLVIQDNRQIVLKKKGNIEFEEMLESDNGYPDEFEDFYHAIRNGREVSSSFSDAYRDLEVIIAALESAQRWDKLKLTI